MGARRCLSGSDLQSSRLSPLPPPGCHLCRYVLERELLAQSAERAMPLTERLCVTECLEVSLSPVLVECLRQRRLRYAALMSACSLAENRGTFAATLIKTFSFCVKSQLRKCCLGGGRRGKAPFWSGGGPCWRTSVGTWVTPSPDLLWTSEGSSAGPGLSCHPPLLLCLPRPGWLRELCKEAP